MRIDSFTCSYCLGDLCLFLLIHINFQYTLETAGEPFPPSVSLLRPLLATRNLVPCGKGKRLRSSDSSPQSRQKKGAFTTRGNKLKTAQSLPSTIQLPYVPCLHNFIYNWLTLCSYLNKIQPRFLQIHYHSFLQIDRMQFQGSLNLCWLIIYTLPLKFSHSAAEYPNP